MPAPFARSPIPDPGFIRNLFKSFDRDYFMIEIENALSESDSVRLASDKIAVLKLRYGISDIAAFSPDGANGIMLSYLQHALADKKLSPVELAEAISLGRLLDMSPAGIDRVRNSACMELYGAEVDAAVSDGTISKEEMLFLDDLKSNMHIGDEVASGVLFDAKKKFIDRKTSDLAADKRLSDEDFIELARYKILLELEGYDSIGGREDKSLLYKYRMFWLIENGVFTPIDTDIALVKGEECYFHAPFSWSELKTVRVATMYSGPQARMRLGGGMYWRAGISRQAPITREEYRQIDSGAFYLTNRRLILVGNKKSISVKLEKILAFERFAEGVLVQKDTGKSPFIEFDFNPDVFCAYLGKLLERN